MVTNTNILVIEDNPADIALIEAYLKETSFKHSLYKYESLSGGLDFLEDNDIDLVLLDLKLVDVEGFKTLKTFRDRAPNVPVVVLTGFKNEIMGIQSVRAGAQDFLVKGDFDARSLARTIRFSLQRFQTQAKLQDEADKLSRKDRRNKLAHQIAQFGQWEMDIVNNSMKWSDEIFRFFGFSPQSFSPTLSDYLKYIHVEDKAKVEAFFEQVIKDGESHQIDHRIVINSTLVKYLHINAQINYDEQANRILLVGGVHDVTSLRDSAGETEETNVAQPPPRIEDSMFKEFNFNIRTPIASVVNFLYLMEKTTLSEAQKDYVSGIKSSLDSLSFALNNWFNLAMLKEEEPDIQHIEIRLGHLLKTLKNVSSLRLEQAEMTSSFQLVGNVPEIIFSDQQKLSQVLYNLLETAVYHGTKGGTVSLKIHAKNYKKDVIRLINELVFESNTFRQDKAEELCSEGMDLDLVAAEYRGYLPTVISASLVEMLGGKFSIAQKFGGRQVHITCDIPVEIINYERPELPLVPVAPVHLLLVEDHVLHRMATKRALLAWSDQVSLDVAANGQEAVDKVAEKSYDLILMDLQMPVLGGIEASIKIRSMGNVPIIALTAHESKQEQERCQMIGMNDYLVKPVEPTVLFQTIMQQLHYQLTNKKK